MASDTGQLAFPPAATTPPKLTMPPRPRLRLAPGQAGRGVMDGGWWPRSRDAVAELTDLLTALTGTGEPPEVATRVTIDFDDWDEIPLRITVLGREVGVGWLAHRDHMVAITRGRAAPTLLLVVPPGATSSSAEAALTRSAVETGDMLPHEILASCDISTRRV
ncbi:hypothetical protein GCM10022254_27610 [Actinomadura meridiana]|uniref:Uncharacterized protein n=1 Tax=Actinomadura meridiana TaxID=559626 RepID=A0ABP8C000_9ACTN